MGIGKQAKGRELHALGPCLPTGQEDGQCRWGGGGGGGGGRRRAHLRRESKPCPLSLSPAWRSDTPLDSRSYASVATPRPTPKPRRKRSEEGRPKPTPRPRKRPQRQEQPEKSETLGLINALIETVDTLRKELEMERKKLMDEVISLRRIHQEKRAETVLPSPSWLQGIVDASQGKADGGVLQLVSQILLAAMDKTPGNQP